MQLIKNQNQFQQGLKPKEREREADRKAEGKLHGDGNDLILVLNFGL